MKIAIIGGGASGLMAGGFLVEKGHEVTIFDANEKCGKKIYITGKGRCNLTNNCDTQTYLSNVVNGEKFMFSAINGFSTADTINFFEGMGLKLKTERGNRVFPQSDKASDVTKALLSHCKGCKFQLNTLITAVVKKGEQFVLYSQNNQFTFDKLIIATGGKSYPATGSKGDGYKFAQMFGHNIIKPRPALVPIKIKDKFVSQLEGLSLKNVSLNCAFNGKTKQMFGEMLFTADAISGPIALSLSSYISQAQHISLSIDLKPALSQEQLEARLLRDFSVNLNKNISHVIKGLMPNRLVEVFLNKLNLDSTTKVNAIKVEQRKNIVAHLKNFPLEFGGLYGVEAGIVTGGGVDLKEVSPKTMESKLCEGLYFIGEVLDIDCLTGGFNLQTAFSTAYACAKGIN
ncbi:MAG: NAD(P)/FAD-dependent oxidoreductase [Clostridia bacterium]|nr:NAD(P)/FAD-dependent oxidoreductase [Clostridia bacterium]